MTHYKALYAGEDYSAVCGANKGVTTNDQSMVTCPGCVRWMLKGPGDRLPGKSGRGFYRVLLQLAAAAADGARTCVTEKDAPGEARAHAARAAGFLATAEEIAAFYGWTDERAAVQS